jgi:hypothetical protein
MGLKHIWTDEDAAFAAAQWASGVKQREIAVIFGYEGSPMIAVKIREFLTKYGALPVLWRDAEGNDRVATGHERKAVVRQALASFVATREGQQ